MRIFYFFILIFYSISSFSQDKFTVSGTVYDGYSKETLIGVSVIVNELKTGTYTNAYGYFSLNLPKGNYTITLSYIGYNTINKEINLNSNFKENFFLDESTEQLNEVIITDNANKSKIDKPEISVNKLSVNNIKKMPVILGETDVIKSILTLPGVTNAGEGQSGFNVRGSAADQNLIILDEATIYNASHLFGFVSVFNTDAIKDIKLYKGGIPARYGGRTASVLEIYQKDGNKSNFKLNGSVGILSSKLLAEGPIKKDKSSFLLAARSSYAHLFLKLTDNNNSAYFYDINTKLSYQLNQNNNLYLSGYFGRDVFTINNSFTNTYGNALFNLRWNHLYNEKLFSNLSLIYSDYYYGLTLDFVGFTWNSGIRNFHLKYDFEHNLSDKINLFYGLQGIYHTFNPGKIEASNPSSGINDKQLPKKYAFEPSLYIEAEHKLSNRLAIQYGLRYSMFYRLGNETLNVYANNEPVVFNTNFQLYEKATPIGTNTYSKNEVIATFNNLEPRMSLAFTLNKNTSLKAGYNKMTQYLHLITNTQSPTPLDVWTPSDNFLKPQILHQYAIGFFKNLKNNAYSLEIETFYKHGKNRLDYIDGADLIANEAIEQVVLRGNTRAYGAELLFKKNVGKFNGWLAYTLSKAEQQTKGRNPNETGINNGNWYANSWDKTHNLSVTSFYNFSDKWKFSALFTLQTGQPVTYPNGQYQYQGITIPTYGLRNENRLPTYHRFDISATLVPQKNKNRKWQTEWVFGIYNIYNRKNAASISFRQNQETGNNEAVKLSIFGIVPSVSYNFKF